MTEQEKRIELKKLYPGSDKWAKRVDGMSSKQVATVYIRYYGKVKHETS